MVKSIKVAWVNSLNWNKQDRIYFYFKCFFVYISFLLGYSALLYWCYCIIAGLLTMPGLTDLMGKPLGSDFVAFYAASKLALYGNSAEIYSISKLHSIVKAIVGVDFRCAWNYPPTFLAMILPLALFPYWISFVLWIFPVLYGYLWMVRRIAPRASLTLRGSSLILATFLATPYAFEYDLSLIALPFAWLGWEEFSKGRRWGQALLSACWIATYFAIYVRQIHLTLLYLLTMFCFVIYRSLTDSDRCDNTKHHQKKLDTPITINP